MDPGTAVGSLLMMNNSTGQKLLAVVEECSLLDLLSRGAQPVTLGYPDGPCCVGGAAADGQRVSIYCHRPLAIDQVDAHSVTYNEGIPSV